MNRLYAFLIINSLGAIDTWLIGLLKNNPDVQKGLRLALEPVKDIVRAVSDANPEDKKQIDAIYKTFIGGTASGFADDQLAKGLAKVKNEKTRAGLALFAPPLVNMLRYLGDENPKDAEQIEEGWQAFLKDPRTHEGFLNNILEPFIRGKFKDPEKADFILTMLVGLLAEIDGLDMANGVPGHLQHLLVNVTTPAVLASMPHNFVRSERTSKR